MRRVNKKLIIAVYVIMIGAMLVFTLIPLLSAL